MNRMIVKFDEKKVREDKLELENLIMETDRFCKNRNIKKNSKGEYVGKDDYDFMVVIGVFLKLDWFKKYISQWLWYENSKYPMNLMEDFEEIIDKSL